MTPWPWALVAAGAASLLYGGFVAWLLLAGRREDGCALAAGCESHSAASRMRTSDRSALIRKLIPSFAQKPRIPAVLPAEVQDKARR